VLSERRQTLVGLEEALDRRRGAGACGLPAGALGRFHTRTAAVFRGEDGEEYKEDAASEAVLKPAQDATPRPPQNPT
jgi:hypothetical protein